MRLSRIQNYTKPVAVEFPDGDIVTLQVRTQRGTLEDRHEFSELVKANQKPVDEHAEQIRVLRTKRAALLAPTQKLVDEYRALAKDKDPDKANEVAALQTKIEAERTKVEKDVEALDAQVEKTEALGEAAIQTSLAQQLAYYVASTDILDEEDKPFPATAEFFRNRISGSLLRQMLDSVEKALIDPFLVATPVSTEN